MRAVSETVTYYYCDYCGQKYSTEEEARDCEAAHTQETADPNGSKPAYHTGDLVYSTRHRWYFVLSKDWKPYWDAEKKCWIYRDLRDTYTSIPESNLRLAMRAAEYNCRMKDIEDKLSGDYFVEICHYHDRVGFCVELEPKGEQQ